MAWLRREGGIALSRITEVVRGWSGGTSDVVPGSES
jgi:hypothetical protein